MFMTGQSEKDCIAWKGNWGGKKLSLQKEYDDTNQACKIASEKKL